MSVLMTRDAPVRQNVTFSDRVAGRPVSLQSRRACIRLVAVWGQPGLTQCRIPISSSRRRDVPGCRNVGRAGADGPQGGLGGLRQLRRLSVRLRWSAVDCLCTGDRRARGIYEGDDTGRSPSSYLTHWHFLFVVTGPAFISPDTVTRSVLFYILATTSPSPQHNVPKARPTSMIPPSAVCGGLGPLLIHDR